MLTQSGDQHRSCSNRMTLNCQVRVDGMGNGLFCIMAVESSYWLRFGQSQGFDLQLVTNNLRGHFQQLRCQPMTSMSN